MGLLTNPNELTMKETYAGLIYGQPGVGKTTLALSSVNPVCIDVDRGMYRVERRYQVPSLQVEDYQQVLDLLNSGELNGFDTVVIDTLGKLIDRMGDYVIKNNPKYRQNNGTLTMQGWGQVKIEFRSLIKLIGGKNKSVIFVAHESEEKEDDVTKKRPDVSGSARKDIVKELDFMGYMEMSGNKRTISFAPSGAYYAKNSLGLDSVIEIPGIQTANSFIKDVVVSAIQKKKEQDEAQAGPYDEVIKTINGIVGAAGDIPAINEAVGKLAGLNHIWDSKIYSWSKISEAAKALGAVWDKAAKRFIISAAPPPAPPAKEAPRPLAGNAAGAARNVATVTAPAGTPVSSSTTATTDGKPAEKTAEQQCQEALYELKNILASRNAFNEWYFSGVETKAAQEKLVTFPHNPPETRLSFINELLEEYKDRLRERIDFENSESGDDEEIPPHNPEKPTDGRRLLGLPPSDDVDIPVSKSVPAMYEDDEEETRLEEDEDWDYNGPESGAAADDGFQDDIPWDEPEDRKPASNRRPAGPLGEGFQKLIREKEAARAANPELDIF